MLHLWKTLTTQNAIQSPRNDYSLARDKDNTVVEIKLSAEDYPFEKDKPITFDFAVPRSLVKTVDRVVENGKEETDRGEPTAESNMSSAQVDSASKEDKRQFFIQQSNPASCGYRIEAKRVSITAKEHQKGADGLLLYPSREVGKYFRVGIWVFTCI